MKQSFKKTTSIVLTLVMVLSLVSAIPFATVSAYVAGGISAVAHHALITKLIIL